MITGGNFAGIGIELFGVKPNRHADIERTLLIASNYVESEDRRILSLIASWILVHAKLVCVGKLKRLLIKEKLGDRQIISALAFLAAEDGAHEWKTLAKRFPKKRLWEKTTSELAIKIKGAQESFAKAGIEMPKSFLRLRASDILPIEKLAKVHLQTRIRLIFGANTRADAIYYLSRGTSSATELMRSAACSYEPAHRILRELKAAGSTTLPELRIG